jgi:hypothetical protein
VPFDGPLGEQAGDEEEHPDDEQARRPEDRQEDELGGRCERDLVDLVVGPSADRRVAEQRVPADDPGDEHGPQVVQVRQPAGTVLLLDACQGLSPGRGGGTG